MPMVKVRTLKPGDRLQKDGNTVVTVAALEWADGYIFHEKTTRAMKLSFVEEGPIIVSPQQNAIKV